MHSTVRSFAFMGRPGSGKGTQAALLGKATGHKVFSSGARFRELAEMDTVVGRKIKRTIDGGSLTPYWFASYLFEETLFALTEGEGIIFEGIGRKEPEARLFEDVMQWLERPYLVIYLDVPEEHVAGRLSKRRDIEGRADDKEGLFARRIEAYERDTLPALNFFRSIGKVIDIDGTGAPEEIHTEIMKRIGEAA